MAKASINIPDDLWKKFNQKVIAEYGKLRSARNKALVEAIKLWLQQPKKD